MSLGEDKYKKMAAPNLLEVAKYSNKSGDVLLYQVIKLPIFLENRGFQGIVPY